MAAWAGGRSSGHRQRVCVRLDLASAPWHSNQPRAAPRALSRLASDRCTWEGARSHATLANQRVPRDTTTTRRIEHMSLALLGLRNTPPLSVLAIRLACERRCLLPTGGSGVLVGVTPTLQAHSQSLRTRAHLHASPRTSCTPWLGQMALSGDLADLVLAGRAVGNRGGSLSIGVTHAGLRLSSQD